MFDNLTIQKQAENLRDFEIWPSDDFVCQYILVEKLNVQSVYLELSRETSTRKLYN